MPHWRIGAWIHYVSNEFPRGHSADGAIVRFDHAHPSIHVGHIVSIARAKTPTARRTVARTLRETAVFLLPLGRHVALRPLVSAESIGSYSSASLSRFTCHVLTAAGAAARTAGRGGRTTACTAACTARGTARAAARASPFVYDGSAASCCHCVTDKTCGIATQRANYIGRVRTAKLTTGRRAGQSALIINRTRSGELGR